MHEEVLENLSPFLKPRIYFCQQRPLTPTPKSCCASIIGGNKHIKFQQQACDLKWHFLLALFFLDWNQCFFLVFRKSHELNDEERVRHVTCSVFKARIFNPSIFCITPCTYITNWNTTNFHWTINLVTNNGKLIQWFSLGYSLVEHILPCNPTLVSAVCTQHHFFLVSVTQWETTIYWVQREQVKGWELSGAGPSLQRYSYNHETVLWVAVSSG